VPVTPPETPVAHTRWDIVLIAVSAGAVAGMQVGKVPPLLPVLISDLNIGPVTAGWIVSMFNLVGASLGIVTGLIAVRLGPRLVVAGGLAMLALGSAAGALAADANGLIMARAVAGVGLVTIAVSAPRIIVTAAQPRDFARALGIWGIYTPAGIAIAMVITPGIAAAVGWRGVWLVNSALIGAFLVLFLWRTSRRHWPHKPVPSAALTWSAVGATLARPGPWLLGALFGCYTIQFFALMSWLPSYLTSALGFEPGPAALLTALVISSNVLGNLLGAALLHRGWPRWLLQLITLLTTSVCGAGVFAADVSDGAKILLAFTFNLAGGLLPAATLAASAVHAPSREQVAAVNGAIVQGANLGSLTGAPALAWLMTQFGGWHASAWLMFIAGSAGCMLVGVVLRIERRALQTSAGTA